MNPCSPDKPIADLVSILIQEYVRTMKLFKFPRCRNLSIMPPGNRSPKAYESVFGLKEVSLIVIRLWEQRSGALGGGAERMRRYTIWLHIRKWNIDLNFKAFKVNLVPLNLDIDVLERWPAEHCLETARSPELLDNNLGVPKNWNILYCNDLRARY
jgi:hypothetical protein